MGKRENQHEAMSRWLMDNRLQLDELDTLVQHAADVYAQYRRQLYPEYRGGISEKKRQLWRRLVMRLRDRNISPEAYMPKMFAIYGDPMIEHMVSEKAFIKFVKHGDSDRRRIARECELAIQKFQQRLRIEKDVRTVLELLADECSDVFIWCAAVYSRLDDIRDRYAAHAQALLGDPDYRAVYHEAFPEVL